MSQMRSWRERLATPPPRDEHGGPRNTYPSVLWPPLRHDLVLDLDGVLFLVRHLTGTLEDEPFEEPTQEEIDCWMLEGMMAIEEGEA